MYHDGNLVFGYEFFYKGKVQVGRHLGGHIHPNVRSERFTLNPGEYIVAVGGRTGELVD